MSSVRISQHSRPGAAPAASGKEAGRAEAPASGANFAVALGAAALIPKAPGPALSGNKVADAVDGGPASRKHTSGDGKTADAAAILAAQGALLAGTGGELLILSMRDFVDGRAAGNAVDRNADLQVTNAPLSAVGQSVAELVASSGAADEVSGSGRLDLSHAGDGISREPTKALSAMQAAASDGLATNLPAADAPAEADGIASNLGPQLPTAPNLHGMQVPPAAMAGLTQELPPVAAGQPDAGSEDAASGSEGRDKFLPVVVAGEGSRAAEAAAVGATSEPPALVDAPASAAAPANIADASATATVSDQVAGHVVRLVATGSREMVMRLHPPELGELTVRVAVSGRDVLAWFGSAQPQVQTAIADGIAQLQTGLGNAGYNLSGAWVGADASGARQQGAALLPLPATLAASAADPVLPNAAVSQPLASAVNIYV